MQHLARSVSVLLCVLLLVSVGLFGQAESGTVSGTITDNAGAGATVTMTSVSTGQTRSTVTGFRSEYAIPSLRPDTYGITVEREGFQKYSRKVAVDVGSRIDF